MHETGVDEAWEKELRRDEDAVIGVDVNKARRLALDHVNWLLGVLQPLLITEFEHGYKHGFRAGRK